MKLQRNAPENKHLNSELTFSMKDVAMLNLGHEAGEILECRSQDIVDLLEVR